MKFKSSAALWAVLFASCLYTSPLLAQETGVKLVQEVKKKEGEVVIPFKKYKLDNGLTLIIHEDHSDPVVRVDVTYHIGSAREEVGKSGFAHFFEHMMFQGSDNVADEEHFKIITESGGTLNGTTNRDRTNYYETMPSNQLETALWLEADRMGFLLDAVTQKKFEVQRETVKNERGQRVDNQPYGLASEYIGKNLYPYGHPYSWMTLGYIEDLNRVNVDDLKNFFLRWYGPNNAVLTVGGDVKEEEVIKLAKKYFGSIPKGPEVKDMAPMLAKLDKDRYVSYEDNYIRMPQLYVTYPVPERYNKDEAALDALAEILGQGKNSIFYKNFQKPRNALFARASNSASELAGEFRIMVRPFPGKTLAEMKEMVDASLKEFAENGFEDEALERFKASYEANFINRLQSVSGKVGTLAAYETYADDPGYLKKEMEAYRSVTRDDVLRVFNQYIKGKPAVILSVYAKGKPDKVAEDNYVVSTENYKPGPDQYSGLKYIKAKNNFDRSKQPAPGPNPVVKVPDYWTAQFDNGMKIIGTKNDEVPSVVINLTLKGGDMLSQKDLTKAGIASITASMLNEDTKNYTAEQFSGALDKLGSSVRISSGSEGFTVSAQSLTKNLDATLKLMEERLMNPVFNEETFDRIKKRQAEAIKNSYTQPSSIASSVYSKLIYGEGNIMGVLSLGTTETIENINLDDVQKFYKDNFSPYESELVVVGDVDKETIMSKLGFLKSFSGPKVVIPELPASPKIDKTTIYLVNVDDAAQSEIRIGYRTDIPYDATGKYFKLGLANYVLGGAFNSRINLNLREDKGYTYGASSRFFSTKTPGMFYAGAGVKAIATDSSVHEFMKEIKDYVNTGITDKELAFMKSSIGQSEAREYETLYQKAGFLSDILRYGLDKSYVAEQQKIIENITRDEINKIAKENLPFANMIIVVVGDASSTKPGLERLGYEIVELDKDGNLAKKAN